MADQVADNHALPTDAGAAVSPWSEHNAPNGRKYYYNSVTGESTWERCVFAAPRTFSAGSDRGNSDVLNDLFVQTR